MYTCLQIAANEKSTHFYNESTFFVPFHGFCVPDPELPEFTHNHKASTYKRKIFFGFGRGAGQRDRYE